MSSSHGRSIEVDLLRGIALIVIAIDHISVSVLSHAMLHNYAYCDAAEVFVFLGGYASAAGYTSICARQGEAAARRRFLRRAWEIYRAYLLTAALMLGCGAIIAGLPVASPLVADSGWTVFSHRPAQGLLDIVTLRQQPFLSAVLPMYLLFALGIPLAIPFARRMPVAAFALSLGAWLAAPWLAAMLPGVSAWPFNPFAWQLLFVLGLLCRLYPVPQPVQVSNVGRVLTGVAFAVALAFTFVKACIDTHPSPGYMKQNLASVRVVSFLALAWLCAQMARAGSLRLLAQRLPAVVTVGRQGLVCFVGGTVVSLAVDTGVRLAHADLNWFGRLAGDLLAVSALLLLAQVAAAWKRAGAAEARARTAPIGWPIRALSSAQASREARDSRDR